MNASKRFKADKSFDSLVSSVESASYIDETMNAKSIHSLFSSLRKAIEKNAVQRTKYAQTPSKFMDSEVALHQELIKWKGMAAFPNLFAHCLEIKDEFVPLLLSLLQHENMDIHFDVVAIIADWTDIEDVGGMAEEELEAIVSIAKSLVEENILTSIVQIIERFEKLEIDEAKNGVIMQQDDQEDTEHETQKVIYHILQVFENMAELAPEACINVCIETTFLSQLVRLIAEKGPNASERKSMEAQVMFPQNKLYASEVLSIMLQLESPVQKAFMDGDEIEKRKANRFDKLLRIIASYRKQNPSSEDEEEFLENILNALCTLLLTREAKDRFRHLEGLELLLRLLKDQTAFMYAGALRLLDLSLMESPRNCEHVVEIGGLKQIFAILMGKTGRYKSSHVTKGSLERLQEKQEEYIINIITSLCVYLSEQARADGFARFHLKLVEKEYEKLDRLIDLFARYHKRVQEKETERDVQTAEEERNREEEKLLLRLDAGLFTLQRISFVLAHCCAFSAKMNGYTVIKFHERQLEFESLNSILQEQLHLMDIDETGEKTETKDRPFALTLEQRIVAGARNPERYLAAMDPDYVREKLALDHHLLPHHRLANIIYDYPYKTIAVLGIPIVGGIYLHQRSNKAIKVSQQVMQARVYGQGALLCVLLGSMAFQDYMSRRGRFE
uniref:Betacateninlike protein putative n=1 Tax=Albugo laibachii Nc14 TaxID=890382 RepID=F0WP27_9STRA|nr:betacateninlike protein putative [Albugo laibachii Nc14]|eukprot:CCA23071.1 betacateninlike protein putative [Albugo laibachii Nc14]